MDRNYAADVCMEPMFWFVDNFTNAIGPVCIILTSPAIHKLSNIRFAVFCSVHRLSDSFRRCISICNWITLLVATEPNRVRPVGHRRELAVIKYNISLLHGCCNTAWISTTGIFICKIFVYFYAVNLCGIEF